MKYENQYEISIEYIYLFHHARSRLGRPLNRYGRGCFLDELDEDRICAHDELDDEDELELDLE